MDGLHHTRGGSGLNAGWRGKVHDGDERRTDTWVRSDIPASDVVVYKVSVIGIADAGRASSAAHGLARTGRPAERRGGCRGHNTSLLRSVPDAATPTSDGGHANGDVVERDIAAPHVLHVEGAAICGTPIRS